MKELNEILETLFTQGYDHGLVNGRGLIGETESVNQARTAILMKSIVPEEESEYTPPTFTSSKVIQSEDYVKGHNACRKEMLRRIDGKA